MATRWYFTTYSEVSLPGPITVTIDSIEMPVAIRSMPGVTPNITFKNGTNTLVINAGIIATLNEMNPVTGDYVDMFYDDTRLPSSGGGP